MRNEFTEDEKPLHSVTILETKTIGMHIESNITNQ